MVPIDAESLDLVDRIIDLRCHGRPMPHPRCRRPAQFLFTHHGRRLSQNAVRAELDRAARIAGLDHITPHQLRHTYATALVNAGVSLQALMVLLGHMSAEMSLRYGRLFDTTVRAEYERALHLATISPHPSDRPDQPAADRHHRWPRLEGHPAAEIEDGRRLLPPRPSPRRLQLANICEHCPSYRALGWLTPVEYEQDHYAALSREPQPA
jgi:Phage integrase family